MLVALALANAVVRAHVPAASAATRTLTVRPNTGLVNQAVRVSWTGFTPTDLSSGLYTVSVYQCRANPKSVDDCYQNFRPPGGTDASGTAIQDAVTDANGDGSTLLEVRPAQDLPSLDCSEAKPCSVLAFENDGSDTPPGQLPSTAVVTPLKFARSAADCPNAPTPDVVTAGEGSAAPALYSWAARICTGAHPLAVDYTESSSPAARREFFNNDIDVGLTSMRAAAGEAKGPRANHLAYAPVDLSGVAIAFNATDMVTGRRITDMTLTPRLVAILLAGQQSGGPGRFLFSDPEFLRLNPGHNWGPDTYPPLLRAESNADAWMLTNWIAHDKEAEDFLHGNDTINPCPNNTTGICAQVDDGWKDVPYPTDTFDLRDDNLNGFYFPRTGTTGNIRRLFVLLPPQDGASVQDPHDGVFAVTDVVTAQKFGLPVARLTSAGAPNGPAVAPDGDGLQKGYAAMTKVTGAGGTTLLPNVSAGNGAYPLAKVDYAMVPTADLSRTKAAHVAQFLQYSEHNGQQSANLLPGYLPLPSALRAQTDAVSSALALAAIAPPPTTTSPSTSTTSTTVASDSSGGSADNTNFASGSNDNFSSSDNGVGSDLTSPVDNGSSTGTGATSGNGATPISTSSKSGLASQLARVAFLGGNNQLILPLVVALGVLALAAGPVMTMQAKGGLRRKKNKKDSSSSPTDESSLEPLPPAEPEPMIGGVT